jgi:hypothetical protein
MPRWTRLNQTLVTQCNTVWSCQVAPPECGRSEVASTKEPKPNYALRLSKTSGCAACGMLAKSNRVPSSNSDESLRLSLSLLSPKTCPRQRACPYHRYHDALSASYLEPFPCFPLHDHQWFSSLPGLPTIPRCYPHKGAIEGHQTRSSFPSPSHVSIRKPRSQLFNFHSSLLSPLL